MALLPLTEAGGRELDRKRLKPQIPQQEREEKPCALEDPHLPPLSSMQYADGDTFIFGPWS